MNLPKPKARLVPDPVASYWIVHAPGTFTRQGWTLKDAYLSWCHRNWIQARILRTQEVVC